MKAELQQIREALAYAKGYAIAYPDEGQEAVMMSISESLAALDKLEAAPDVAKLAPVKKGIERARALCGEAIMDGDPLNPLAAGVRGALSGLSELIDIVSAKSADPVAAPADVPAKPAGKDQEIPDFRTVPIEQVEEFLRAEGIDPEEERAYGLKVIERLKQAAYSHKPAGKVPNNEQAEALRKHFVVTHMDLDLDYPGAPEGPMWVAFAKWLVSEGYLAPAPSVSVDAILDLVDDGDGKKRTLYRARLTALFTNGG